MASGDGSVQTVIMVIVVALAVLVSIPLLGQFAMQTSETGKAGATNERVAISTSSSTYLGSNPVTDVTVKDSTGQAVHLSYEDASISASGAGPSDAPLSMSVWAELDDNASVANDYHLLDANGTAVLQYRNGNYVAHFNNSTHNATVSTTAPAPKSLTHVGLRVDNGYLAIYVNGTYQNQTAVTTGNSTADPAVNLYGTLDEIRTWDSGISNATFGELYSDPVGGQESTSPLARIMFDEGSGDSAHIIYVGTNADLSSGVTWVNGLSGTVLQEDRMLSSGDYSLNKKEGTIRATGSGELADAPVAYVTFTSKPAATSWGIFDGITNAMGLIPLFILAALASIVIARLR